MNIIDTLEATPLLSASLSTDIKPDYGIVGNDHIPKPKAQNSWWATGIQCLNSMLGSGILAFPYLLSEVGWVMFVIEILFFALVVFISSAMLIEVGQRKGLLNYSAVTENVFGPQVAKLLKLSIVVAYTGSLMSFLNVIGSLGYPVIIQWGYSGSIFASYSGFMLFAAALIAPLTLFRSYGELTPISLVSLALITYLVFFVLGEGLWLNNGQLYTAQAWPLSWTAPIQTLGTLAFAGSIQTLMFEAYLSTREEDKPIFASAIGCGFLLLVLMAVFGYGAFGSDCENDIISNFSSSYVLVQISQLITVLHVTFYIPNAFIIMRLYAFELMDCNPLTLEWPSFALITLSLWVFPVFVMAWIPEEDCEGTFAYVIDLAGGLPFGFSAFALPAALYFKVTSELPIDTGVALFKHYASRATLVLGVFLMIVCPITDTYFFIKACVSGSCSSY